MFKNFPYKLKMLEALDLFTQKNVTKTFHKMYQKEPMKSTCVNENGIIYNQNGTIAIRSTALPVLTCAIVA